MGILGSKTLNSSRRGYGRSNAAVVHAYKVMSAFLHGTGALPAGNWADPGWPPAGSSAGYGDLPCALAASVLRFQTQAWKFAKTGIALLIVPWVLAPCVNAQQTGAWWNTFGETVLDRIVEEVLESSLDLEAAVARVEQARMEARLARASRWPLAEPSASGVDIRTPTNAGIGAQLDELGLGGSLEELTGVALPDRLGLTTYTAGLEFAYEADFWGRNRNYARSARAKQLASESEFAAARIGIIAETISTYFEIVNLRTQRNLAQQSVGVAEELSALATSEYERGLTELDNLYAARRQLRSAEAAVSRLEAMQAKAEGRLWSLLGGYSEELAIALPDSMTAPEDLLTVPEQIETDLLLQRPDVSAARLRVDAASHAVGARRAELWPRLALQGFIGFQGTRAEEWFDVDQWFRNLSLNLAGPLIQRSRRRSQLALARAQLDEAAARYGQSVITAVSEVEAALLQLKASQRRYELLDMLAEDSETQQELLEDRYNAGIVNYGQFLTGRQAHISAQALLAAADLDLRNVHLALNRALGGAWAADRPESSE